MLAFPGDALSPWAAEDNQSGAPSLSCPPSQTLPSPSPTCFLASTRCSVPSLPFQLVVCSLLVALGTGCRFSAQLPEGSGSSQGLFPYVMGGGGTIILTASQGCHEEYLPWWWPASGGYRASCAPSQSLWMGIAREGAWKAGVFAASRMLGKGLSKETPATHSPWTLPTATS